MKKFTRFFYSNSLLWVSIALTLTYLLIVFLRPPGYFMGIDEGGKFTYLVSTLKTGDPGAPILYPNRSLDPGLEFVPLYYRVSRGNGFTTWWPIGFPLLSAPFYQLLGWMGLFLIPAVSGGACAFLSGKITELLKPQKKWLPLAACLLVGLATPVVFYSTMFWEHTLAVAAMLGAVYLVLIGDEKQRGGYFIAAGALSSFAFFIRTETALLSAGVGLVLLVLRFKWAIRYGISFCLCCIPWMVFSWLMVGHPISTELGSIIATHAAISKVGWKFLPYFLFNAPTMYALAFGRNQLIAGTILTFLAVTFPFICRLRWIGLIASLGLLGLLSWALLTSVQYRAIQGFILAAPLVVFSTWIFADWKFYQRSLYPWMVLIGGAVFGIVYFLRSWVAAGGFQWGPRYLLIFYPLLGISALLGWDWLWREKRLLFRVAFTISLTVAIVMSMGFELRGMVTLQQTYVLTHDTDLTLRTLNDHPLVSNWCEITMLIPDYYWDQEIFSITRSTLARFAANAQKVGIDAFYRVDFDLCSLQTLNDIQQYRLTHPGGLYVELCKTADVLKGEACQPVNLPAK